MCVYPRERVARVRAVPRDSHAPYATGARASTARVAVREVHADVVTRGQPTKRAAAGERSETSRRAIACFRREEVVLWALRGPMNRRNALRSPRAKQPQRSAAAATGWRASVSAVKRDTPAQGEDQTSVLPHARHTPPIGGRSSLTGPSRAPSGACFGRGTELSSEPRQSRRRHFAASVPNQQSRPRQTARRDCRK